MKRPYEGKGGEEQMRGGKRGAITSPYILKFLTPEVLASAVIGKGGASIAQLRQSAQAKISLTEHNELFPGTDCRILTAQANAEESLVEVSRQIIAKVGDCAQGQSSLADSLGTPEELKLRTLVPRAAVGGIIGKGGGAIKQLREASGANISITEALGPGQGADQVITLLGPQDSLEHVMEEINRQVQKQSSEAWFQGWASNANVQFGAGGGGVALARSSGAVQAYDAYSPPEVRYEPDFRRPARAGKGGCATSESPGLDVMMRVGHGLPSYVMDDTRGFAMSCVVPVGLVGGLIGRGGTGTKEIQGLTQTKIGIREIPGDAENRTLNIAGPLANTCAAYMLMMKRYLDAEAQSVQAVEEGKGRPPRRR